MASPPLFSRRKLKGLSREPRPLDGDDEGMNAPIVVRKPAKSTSRNNPKPRSFKPAEGNSPYLRGTTLEIVSNTFQPIDRPSYTKDYLTELRNSTPTTPKDLSTYASSAEDDIALNVASKFGLQQPSSAASHIPSAAEIEEKKQRRARLAKEQESEDYIALEDYDSDGEFKVQRMQVSAFVDTSEKDTRLVRDDEDMAEGFEAFVDDPGKVILSSKARRDQERKEKDNMRSMIAEAEHSSDESDSSAERINAYETAQTSHGMDGLSLKKEQTRRPQQPKEIKPIPKLAAVLARFREGIKGLEHERVRLEKQQADLQREQAEILAREENIQRLLVETGEKFERLRREVEIPVNENSPARGLDILGNTSGP